MLRKIITLTFFCSFHLMAITPSLLIDREIYFGVVLPEVGSCRMIASTSAIVSSVGFNICVLPENAHTGLYTIVSDPFSTVSIKILPDLTTGNGIVFNPFVEIVSDGYDIEIISNNVGAKTINSGADGIVNLYLGGVLKIEQTLPYNQPVTFTFVDAIEWSVE